MAKKTAEPKQTVINDFRIEVRSVDRTRKDLNSWRLALQSAENVLRPSRKLLYDLYADIVLDDHLTSVMGQRRLAATTSTLVFQHDGKEVPSINALIETEEFEQIIEHMIDARFYGYSLIKVDMRAGLVELVPRANVVPQAGVVTQNPYDPQGIDYTRPPYTNLYMGVGRVHDLGLILPATPLVMIKRGNLSDWAQFNEIFGQPMRVGKYDPNMPGQREQMQKALEESGAMAYLSIPVGSELEFVEANKTGATDTYDTLYERMEKGLSKLIVGQTMTTEDGSSLSQSEVHERVAGKIAASDRRYILRYLNGRFREMLLAQGYTEAARGEFQFVDEEESIPKDARLKMDLDIHRTVGPLKKEYYAQEYNVEFVSMDDAPAEPDPAPEPDPDKPAPKGPKDQTRQGLKLLAQLRDFFG